MNARYFVRLSPNPYPLTPFLQRNALLVGSGLVTALPLALFAYGARQIPLSTVGLVQYIGPTLQFLIGVFVFHEAFTAERAVGFVMIWAALAIYAADGAYRTRRRRSGR